MPPLLIHHLLYHIQRKFVINRKLMYKNEVIIIANSGKRCLCRCIKSMNIIIGKEENTLFEKGAIYDCVIKGEINEQLYYKVYGDEFTLSCTEKEFHQNFLIIKHKKTNEGK